MKQYFFLIFFGLMFCFTDAQTIQQLTSNNKSSLRGLSVINNNIIWASGSGGQIVRSTDGGEHFEWITVKNYEQRDFRDIEAFDANTAVIMAVDVPAIILKTKDGGKTWKEVYHNDTKGMFLDAMDFTKDGNGVVVGDPINNKLFIAATGNYGDKWLALKPENNFYTATNGEAFFAASGTNVKITGNKYNPLICFVTGGTDARMFFNATPAALNIIHGKAATGAYSIAINNAVSRIVITGGDYTNPTSAEKNCEVFTINGQQLLTPAIQTPPHGYRSCVTFITNDSLICCGATGVDISNDGGLNWRLISDESYNICAKAKNGTAVFLAGENGKISKLIAATAPKTNAE